MRLRRILIPGLVLAGFAAWWLFHPERLILDRSVSEPAVESRLLASGSFRGIAHETKGVALWLEQPDGTQSLRLENFATSDGPRVEVYLVAAEDAPDNQSVRTAGFISLGPIKGNIGSQNYVIPAGTDPTKYRCVSIWCSRFGVNFGVAPLKPVP